MHFRNLKHRNLSRLQCPRFISRIARLSILTLRGDHADLLKLQTQLNERLEKLIKQRDAAYTEAASLLNEGQAKKAYRLICRVKTQDLRDSDVKLRTQLEEIVAAEDALAIVTPSLAVRFTWRWTSVSNPVFDFFQIPSRQFANLYRLYDITTAFQAM